VIETRLRKRRRRQNDNTGVVRLSVHTKYTLGAIIYTCTKLRTGIKTEKRRLQDIILGIEMTGPWDSGTGEIDDKYDRRR
jgi:hypothetical protein